MNSTKKRAEALHRVRPMGGRLSAHTDEREFLGVSYPHDYQGFRTICQIGEKAADVLLEGMGWPEATHPTIGEFSLRTSGFSNKLAVMIPATEYGEESCMFLYRHDSHWWLCIWLD